MKKMMFLFLVLMLTQNTYAQGVSGDMAKRASDIALGMGAMFFSKASENPRAGVQLGFPDVEALRASYEREQKYSVCTQNLAKANLEVGLPMKYFGDSSSLMVHVKDGEIHVYTKDGLTKIKGNNCQAMDKNKNVSDGLIEIAQHAVNMNTNTIQEKPRTAEQVKSETNSVKDMLQACGKVDSKFADYAHNALQTKYNSGLNERPAFQNSGKKDAKKTVK